MDTLTIFLIIAALVIVQAVGLTLAFGWLRRSNGKPGQDTGGLVLLQERIDALGRILDDKLDKGSERMFERIREQ